MMLTPFEYAVQHLPKIRSTFVERVLVKRCNRLNGPSDVLTPMKGREHFETKLSLQVRYHRIIACGTFKPVEPYFFFVFIFVPWIIAIDAIVAALIFSRAVGSGHFW